MKELLKLARGSLEAYFKNERLKVSAKIKKKYSDKKACFVTLSENKKLRGCIGSLKPRQELWKDVVENSVNAGFHDFRFFPLAEKELGNIKIEISVLTIPKRLGIGEKVFDKINKKVGIILKKDGKSATFLPQVWEQISSKRKFLEQLSIKAGLNKDDWKNSEIWFYKVESVRE